jgi:acetylxylan esterase
VLFVPELFVAVSLYSGVAAGCFVVAGVDQWNTCANGQSTGAPEKLETQHAPCIPDTTISLNNYQDELKQWTNVLGVSMTPTATEADYLEENHALSDYGLDVECMYVTDVGHSVPSPLAVSEAWFELP